MLSLNNKLLLRVDPVFNPVEPVLNPSRPRRCAVNDPANRFPETCLLPEISHAADASLSPPPAAQQHPDAMDPLYLFACHIAWERDEDPIAGWELIAAAQSTDDDTRAHARALLASSHHLGGIGLTCGVSPSVLQSLNHVSHKSNLPAGAILFVEGQAPGECSSSAPAR